MAGLKGPCQSIVEVRSLTNLVQVVKEGHQMVICMEQTGNRPGQKGCLIYIPP